MRTITCAHLISDADAPPARAQQITIADGLITSVGPAPAAPVDPIVALPALGNAHDHRRAVRSSSIGAGGKPLEAWLLYLALFPSVDSYFSALEALSHSALGAGWT